MTAVSSSNHCQRSGRNLVDGHAIPGSGLLLTTWQTPTLGFRKQERQLRTGSTGGCLQSIAQCTRSGACSYWIGCALQGRMLHHHTLYLVLKCSCTSSLPSSRCHLSCDDCLEYKREDYQNCSVLYCVPQLYTVISTHI